MEREKNKLSNLSIYSQAQPVELEIQLEMNGVGIAPLSQEIIFQIDCSLTPRSSASARNSARYC